LFYEGRGRGGRGHLTSTTTRLPPSTHFVRPQPEPTSHSQFYSTSSSSINNHHRANSLEIEFQRNYATTLSRYYGTRSGQSINASDYGDFRISMFYSTLEKLSLLFILFRMFDM
jgi:hypothetical protein